MHVAHIILTAEPRPVIGPQAVSAQPMSGRDGDEMRRPRRRHQMTPGLDTKTAETLDFILCTLYCTHHHGHGHHLVRLQSVDMTAFEAAAGELRGESH